MLHFTWQGFLVFLTARWTALPDCMAGVYTPGRGLLVRDLALGFVSRR